MEMVIAIFLLSFINIGFISILQRLMHVLDYDLEGKNTSPWRTELLYTLYFTAVTAFVFGMALSCPTTVERLMWVNCVLVLMMSYTDAVKTRLNIILALVVTVGLFFLTTTSFSYWLLMTLAIGIIALMGERQWFFPFDRHPAVVLSVKACIGAISWLGLTAMLHLSFIVLLTMYVVYLVVTFITYYYMVLIRREHLNNVDAARNVLFDNLTHARNWLSFRSDADDYFQNYSALNVIAMDIDNFKHINDTYGHLAGNTTLIQFSNQLEKILAQNTEGARLYRTGGEEFTILYPGVTEEVATQLAEILQTAVHDLRTTTEKGQQIRVTVSMGVENRREDDKDALDIFKRADRLLYVSKRNGKNQISIGAKD
ncbi:GGDEF domain-containing protein [Lactobacillus sp. LC28-10]|uniref:GGDEF domain-containing protein n=1 Tax=Secundilactobacillus angelensis TaxID=2722706 RepID=A0ABX1KZI4_9LACO|nr:GGDEF domain-containing protein [Secundilactobacillus angelensis]MCH5461740.1 GGDEF domain-containing protein [Secundilactobacillus angelensis]NLR18579.1 GGDEF domain-containing protein [Secundilactobacillus angelensis]